MAGTWYILAAGTALRWAETKTFAPWLAGALAGAVYGIAVYGVFNFTNNVMFKEYGWGIVLRDFAWGVTWACVLTTLFMVFK
jgi:uncharacterized membrane protein